MYKLTILTAVSLLVLVPSTPATAAGPCQFLVGPPEAIDFAPNPETGLLELTVPVTIGGNPYHADLQVALLGSLEVFDDGVPRRVLLAHQWRLQENGIRLEWFGEAFTTRTNDPTVVRYTVRLDLAESTRRWGDGVLFAQGEFNVVNGTGTAENFFGRLCFESRPD